eukprot:6364810-Amphidinium_carterae.1
MLLAVVVLRGRSRGDDHCGSGFAMEGEFHVPPARLNDVLTLNVGGELFTVKRETLCVCKGSYMTVLFSGQSDISRKNQHPSNTEVHTS